MLRDVRVLIAIMAMQGCSSDAVFGPGTGSNTGGGDAGGSANVGGAGDVGGGPGSGGQGQGGAPATCGNGTVQSPEECDGSDLAGGNCTDFGFSSTEGLSCTASCAYDASGCKPTCDGQLLEPGEVCDGSDLGSTDCTMFGFSNPAGLACVACQPDPSGCMPTCDGQLLELGEVCDGTDLGGADCTSFGYVSPAGLACDRSCQLDSEGCTAVCGNMVPEPGEDCDDGNFDPTDGCNNCQLSGNTCGAPITISMALGAQTFTGTTVGGGQHQTSLCPNEDTAPDRIYAVTAQTAGFLTASLIKSGTNYDSILYALTNCNDPGSGIWCTDNGSLNDPNGGETLSFEMQQGQTAYIIVDGYLGASGNYQLLLDLSAGTCADPVPLPIWQPGPTSGRGNTNNKPNNHGTNTCGGASSSDVVYEVTPQFTGNIDVRLPSNSTGYDSVLSARTVCTQQATELACSHQTGDDFFTVVGATGVPFYVIVDGFSGSNGEYRLRLDPF
jgi:hypothetical protein